MNPYPMQITRDLNLKSYNTFGLDVSCKYFVALQSVQEAIELLSTEVYQKNSHLILGGGSNVLLTKDFEGLVIHNGILGKELIHEDEDRVVVKIGAGEVWHESVLWTLENHWGGIENLSLIPGTVGAAPMQNIGAYGVEIKDVFVELSALNLASGKLETFSNEDCEFGYRESVFKKALKGKYLITEVTLQLQKKPTVNVAYGAIQETLSAMGVEHPTIRDVSNAVIKIRQSKLPDPAQIGNAGSFFKNPTVTKPTFVQLQSKYPNIPGYELSGDAVKVPAGWLIEQCGWKGKVLGEIGVHKNQALVLVNYGNGKGKDIEQLSRDIRKSVEETFGISLTPEVNII